MIEAIPENLQAAMLSELKNGWELRKRMAEQQTNDLGKVNHSRHRSLDGVGQLKCRVDADSYHYWGQRLGYQCWADKNFVDEYMKRNPYCRVNSGGTKEVHVGFIPPKETSPRKVKFTKTFV